MGGMGFRIQGCSLDVGTGCGQGRPILLRARVPNSGKFYILTSREARCLGKGLSQLQGMESRVQGLQQGFVYSILSRIYYTTSQNPVVINKVFKDWRPGGTIRCNNCGEVSKGL